MPLPADSNLQDDASGEAWYQKGTTLLKGRKQEREIEEKLRKAMNQSLLMQWQMWVALILGINTFWQIQKAGPPLSFGLGVFITFLFIVSALDSANQKRTEAILAWIKHEQNKQRVREGRAQQEIDATGSPQ